MLITAQIPVAQWHDMIGDAKMTTALLDRLTTTAKSSRQATRAGDSKTASEKSEHTVG